MPATSGPAKLEPPAGRVVHGMGQWEEHNAKLLEALPRALRPAAQLLFVQIGDTPRGWRPSGLAQRLEACDREGFIPVLDIGLRGNQPLPSDLKKLADPLFGIDHEVAAGTRFDGRIEDLIRAIREFRNPVLVRIGGEFNGWWNGYHPFAYPKAFRKIAGMFRTAGAGNAVFCWCYEPAGPADFDARDAAGESKWYPGADAIDWFGIDWFQQEDFTGPLSDARGLTAHGRSRKFLDMAVAAGKPVIVAESAPCRYDLSDPARADAAWREWFEPYFQTIAERPEIKWFHLISYDWPRASYFAQSGWKNNDLTVDAVLLERLLDELGKPRYLHSGEREKLGGYASLTLSARARPARPDRKEGAMPPVPRGKAAGSDAGRLELAKWENASAHLPPGGPGGTEWDAHYRSFIQSDERAAERGFPLHARAAAEIVADAAKGAENLRKHKGWVLFIKHHSQAYRPESATADLKRLYEALVDIEFGGMPAQGGLPFDGDQRLIIRRDVPYGGTATGIQKLDAYLVKASRPTAVVIEIHGGGWRRGAKSQFVYPGDLVGEILGVGISVVSIEYRLTPEHVFPAQMEDVVRAVKFVRSKAEEWNIAPDRIAAMGGSAGAHLSAWVALHDDLADPASADPVDRHSSRLSCFVAIAGPMDLTRVRPAELARQSPRGEDFANAFTAALGCTPQGYEDDEAVRSRIRDASPLFLVSPDDPPAFIAGAWDGNEPDAAAAPSVILDPHSAWHGILLADAMRRAGVQVVTRFEIDKDAGAGNAAILTFLRDRLLSGEGRR